MEDHNVIAGPSHEESNTNYTYMEFFIWNLFQMMLVSSDPLISSLRKTCKKKIYELSPEVKSLLDFESEDEENCSNSDTDETGENSDLELDISSLSM